MNSAVIVFPGSNCDRDIATALELVTERRDALLARGRPLAHRLFAEPPHSFATRMTAMWESWYAGRQ